jgi:hypothetical protein
MMRALSMLLLVAIGGCGDSGAAAPSCDELTQEFDEAAKSNGCTVDADCAWIADGCFREPLCDTFVNVSVAAAARQYLAQAQGVCACATCTAQAAACNAGVCGPKTIPDGASCVRDSDCAQTATAAPNGAFGARVCAYKIADGCAATGRCATIPSPTCASFTELCGCDGSPVRAGSCFYADGYAGGPTTGATLCADGGV